MNKYEEADVIMEDYIKNNIKSYTEYAWNYFNIHASQRLTTFNFFITISTLIGTGIFAALYEKMSNYYVSAFLSIGLMSFSFIFWKLDVRNRELIKNSESALKEIEKYFCELSENNLTEIMLFNRDDNAGKEISNLNLFKKRFSYSDCFNLTYLIFAVSGLVGFMTSIYKSCL